MMSTKLLEAAEADPCISLEDEHPAPAPLVDVDSRRPPLETDRIRLFDLELHNLSKLQAVETIVLALEGDTPRQLCFVNADCVNISYQDETYRYTLKSADYLFVDGIGMKIAGLLFGRTTRENLCGTDLFPRLCQRLEGTGKSIYLLGARPGITERVAAWIKRTHPGTIVAGHHHGYFAPSEQDRVLGEIRGSGADVLLVAFGAPRQDVWTREHLEQSGVKLAMGVGGLFDFYSGRIPRAPRWIRKLGMEWAYRLWQEPRRLWRRYVVGNCIFLSRAVRLAAWQRLIGLRACLQNTRSPASGRAPG